MYILYKIDIWEDSKPGNIVDMKYTYFEDDAKKAVEELNNEIYKVHRMKDCWWYYKKAELLDGSKTALANKLNNILALTPENIINLTVDDIKNKK